MPSLPDAEKERLKELARDCDKALVDNAPEYSELVRKLKANMTPSTVTALLEELEESKAERVALALSAALSNEGTVKWREKAEAAEAERDRMREVLEAIQIESGVGSDPCVILHKIDKIVKAALTEKGVTP